MKISFQKISLFTNNYFLPIVLIAIHLFLLINLRFEAWPEMLVYPYLLNNNFSLYQDIINPYVPVFTWILQLYFSVVSISITNLKLITWTIILVTDILVFTITKKHFGKNTAIAALVFFVIFQPLLDGNGLWYDLSLAPVLLLAFHFQSPILLGLSFFIKQSVIWLFIIYLKKWKKLFLSIVLFFLISSTPFYFSNSLNDYWFWSWQFPFTIFPFMPGHKDFGQLYTWALALFPFFLPMILLFAKNQSTKIFFHPTNPSIWMLLCFLFIFPRFGLFHLQPALAFAALSLGKSASKLNFKSIIRSPVIKILLTSYFLLLASIWFRHIKYFWHTPTRFFEPGIVQAAQKLSDHTDPKEPLLFLNSPRQLMVISNRLPTKPWIDTFPWYLELPGMQQKIIESIKNQNNSVIVFSQYQDKGQYQPGSYTPSKINNFINKQFANQQQISDNIFLLTK